MAYTVRAAKEDIEFSTDLPHMEQVEKFRIALNNLIESEKDAKSTKEKAKAEKNAQLYLEADSELDRIAVLWTPFINASAKADKLKADGYKLADPQGDIIPVLEGYVADAVVTLFLIIVKAVVEDFTEKFGQQTQQYADGKITLAEYGEALVQLTPGLRILQDFRDQIIPKDDNGEIARLIRDPIKRPIEIIQNLRDGIISPQDNGEIARIIRDPIKRPIEVISDGVKHLFGW
jgi:hypothetical protein